MTDVSHEVNAVERRVGERTIPAGQARTVTVTRTYDTTPEDLWDACTRAERIARWFLPVSGDLREGGRYQLEGNAGGTIERCDPPRAFDATWEYGPMMSWIELRISPADDGRARFELHHIALVDDGGHWERYGPGAVGVGWDLGLLGLARHLESGEAVDPKAFEAWTLSDEGRAFVAAASADWGEAAIAAGADPDAARAAAGTTTAFYTGTA